MYRILLVDEVPEVTSALADLLHRTPLIVRRREWHSQVETFSSPAKALMRMQVRGFDLALSGLRMFEMDGVTLLRRFHDLQPDAVRMIVSSHADLYDSVAVINREGIERFITRPWNDLELIGTIAEVLDRRARYLRDQTVQQLGGGRPGPSLEEPQMLLEPSPAQTHCGSDT